MRLIVLFVVILLAAAQPAAAQEFPRYFPGTLPSFPVVPYAQDMWWDPARGGSGWFFSQLPPREDGGVPLQVAAHYGYDATGKADWMLVSGVPYQPTTPLVAFETGVLGTLSGPLHTAVGGACPTCPYVAPLTVMTPYNTLTITYVSAMRAQVDLGGEDGGAVEPIDLALIRPLHARLTGTWRGVVRMPATNQEGAISEYGCGPITVRPMAAPTTEDRYEAALPAEQNNLVTRYVPHSGARWFELEAPLFVAGSNACDDIARPRQGTGFAYAYLWIDEASQRVLAFQHGTSYRPVGTVTDGRPQSWQITGSQVMELHLEGPDAFVMRVWPNRVPTGRTAPTNEARFVRVP
jgi:hypothetical protein